MMMIRNWISAVESNENFLLSFENGLVLTYLEDKHVQEKYIQIYARL